MDAELILRDRNRLRQGEGQEMEERGEFSDDEYVPYGGFRSVTFVLCASFPVQRLAREGQHTAVVQ